jgi:hypothetical protein
MDILRTKVFPGVERNVALAVLKADMRKGMPVLFSLADKRSGSISGCKRMLKSLTSEYCGVQDSSGPTLSNYTKGYCPLTEVDIETCVKGFGTRFPCNHAWILSVQNLDVFLKAFNGNSEPVNQNSFLPGTCNAFCFGVFGALALAVRTLSLDNAFGEIDNDDPLEPFQAKNWAYMHFGLNERDRSKIAGMMKLIGAELDKHLNVLAKSVKSRRDEGSLKPLDAPRVSLSSVAKKHFKRAGYVWNKSESEPRVTAFDKVTERGNVIRITADAGGHNELIPSVNAKFIGATFISPTTAVVSAVRVVSEADLQSLLDLHERDVRYFEENIASIYDREMGQCHPTITKLIQEQNIRRIE